MNKSAGFSLIELMIAMLLSILLLGGTVVLFEQGKRNSVQNEAIARMQESGRYALRLLARDISMGGFYGGVQDFTAFALTNEGAAVTSDCNSILDLSEQMTFMDDPTGAEVNAAFSCISASDIQTAANYETDVIAIKRVLDAPAATTSDDKIYIAADTVRAILFGGTSNSSSTPQPPSGPMENSQVWEYTKYIYYIQDAGLNDGIPTLCREILLTDAGMTQQCLVEGIENLQIEFGIDTDINFVPEYYTANPSAAEMDGAVTARVYVLVRSHREIVDYVNDKTYQLGSKSLDPLNDGFYRRVFSTTVKIRNPGTLKENDMMERHIENTVITL